LSPADDGAARCRGETVGDFFRLPEEQQVPNVPVAPAASREPVSRSQVEASIAPVLGASVCVWGQVPAVSVAEENRRFVPTEFD